MAKVHKSYRIEAGTVAEVEAYAHEAGVSNSEAVERLLRAGLDAGQEDQAGGRGADLQGVCDVLRQSNADLRQTVSTLVAQLAVKDEQTRRLADIADHAQALQAAQAQTQLLEAAGAVDAQQGIEQDGTRRQGWRARLARWIAGGKE